MVRRGVRKDWSRIRGGVMRDKGGMEQDCRRDHCGQERSQEGQGRKGTGSGETTVVRRGFRRDKEGKEQKRVRPLWSGEE